MTLSLETIKNVYGFSIAKYSTWFYYKPDHILFDAGEGISVSMRNMIYGINHVFISHGHGDHIGGLPGLMRSRASSMGDKGRPITIYYPKNDAHILRMADYIRDTMENPPFEIEWHELSPGDRIQLAPQRSLEAFASIHTNSGITLGYKILEHRVRLKAEYRDLPKDQIVELIKKEGKEKLSEHYEHVLLCYSGDSMPLDKSLIANSEVLLHDATFLDAQDRDENTHATIEEVLQSVKDANISIIGLFHLSARYKHQKILEKIQEMIKLYSIKIPVFYMFSHLAHLCFKKVE